MPTNQHQMSRHNFTVGRRAGLSCVEALVADEAQDGRHVPSGGVFSRRGRTPAPAASFNARMFRRDYSLRRTGGGFGFRLFSPSLNIPPMIVGKSREMVSTAAISRVARCARLVPPRLERQRRLPALALPAGYGSRLKFVRVAFAGHGSRYVRLKLSHHACKHQVQLSECHFSHLSSALFRGATETRKAKHDVLPSRAFGAPDDR